MVDAPHSSKYLCTVRVHALVLSLSFAQMVFGQIDFIDQRWNTSLHSDFNALVLSEYLIPQDCTPKLKAMITEPGKLEKSISDLIEDDELEMACMQTILHDDCQRYRRIMSIHDLYAPLFQRHLEAKGLENTWSYLPLIISGSNIAYQSDLDEVGLWGFNYVEARKYGLTINQAIDERMSADHSTKAASRKLKELHQLHDGSPVHMLAHWVKGERWTKKRSEEEIKQDPELRQILCCLKIVIRLDQNVLRENHLIRALSALGEFDAIVSKDTILISAMHKVLDGNLEQWKAMNPVYISDVIPGGYRMVPYMIDKQAAAAFPQKKKEIIAEAKRKSDPEKKVVADESKSDWRYYVVQSGDVLGLIAQKLQVKIDNLRVWNGIRGDLIYAGQKLKYKSAINKNLQSDNPKPVKNAEGLVYYTVKPGESLWLIAKKYPGVSADNIMEWNQINEDIQPGMKLKIYTK